VKILVIHILLCVKLDILFNLKHRQIFKYKKFISQDEPLISIVTSQWVCLPQSACDWQLVVRSQAVQTGASLSGEAADSWRQAL